MIRQRRGADGGGAGGTTGSSDLEVATGGIIDDDDDCHVDDDDNNKHNVVGGGSSDSGGGRGKRSLDRRKKKKPSVGGGNRRRKRSSSSSSSSTIFSLINLDTLRQGTWYFWKTIQEWHRRVVPRLVRRLGRLTALEVLVVVLALLFLGLPLSLFVFSERKVLQEHAIHYDVHDCPIRPPKGYPREYPVHDVLANWPTDQLQRPTLMPSTEYNNNNAAAASLHSSSLHQHRREFGGICVFDENHKQQSHQLSKEKQDEDGGGDDTNLQRIWTYRDAEVPFVIQGDPSVLNAARWQNDGYLSHQLANKIFQATIVSANDTRTERTTERMSFEEWMTMTTVGGGGSSSSNSITSSDSRHGLAKEDTNVYAALRLEACPLDEEDDASLCRAAYRRDSTLDKADFLWQDLRFFTPPSSTKAKKKRRKQQRTNHGGSGESNHYDNANPLYDLTDQASTGITCQLSSPGFLTETQLDDQGGYYIAVLKGAVRYLLAHPRNCGAMYLTANGNDDDGAGPNEVSTIYHSQIHLKNWTQSHHHQAHNVNPSAGFHHHHHANHPQHPDFGEEYPNFAKATVNQVVLEAGDVLFMPTHWLHHVVSLTTSYVCWTPSSHSSKHERLVKECMSKGKD